jgi:two-component system OmpR family response regulator
VVEKFNIKPQQMGKILVVNNDIDAMSLLKKWLERKTYKVKYTSNGEEVPDIVKKFAPDLLLVDVLHSKLAEELKTNEQTKKIPIILMTGYTILNENISTEDVDDVIEKPFNLPLLEKKVEALLKKTG